MYKSFLLILSFLFFISCSSPEYRAKIPENIGEIIWRQHPIQPHVSEYIITTMYDNSNALLVWHISGSGDVVSILNIQKKLEKKGYELKITKIEEPQLEMR